MELHELYQAWNENREDTEKEITYFRALADARLTDYYTLHRRTIRAERCGLTMKGLVVQAKSIMERDLNTDFAEVKHWLQRAEAALKDFDIK
ncbi:MAG: hypothetical protein K8L99_02425 [Anaerolineae bacterium]|nr:hypothetical protein [Anaerolineae bacterium]